MSIETDRPSEGDSSEQTRPSPSRRNSRRSADSDFTVTINRIESNSSPTQDAADTGCDGDFQEPAPGRLLGDFNLIKEIGRGGMGVVFEAKQRSLGKRVAVKVLPSSALVDKRVVKRFQNEAWAAAQLQHRNIVPVYQVGTDRGVYYYAMQFVDGINLGQLFQSLRVAAEQREPQQRLSPGPPAAPKGGSTVRTESSRKDTVTTQQLIEFVERSRSTAGPQFLAALTKMGIQVADALHYAHEMGVVHRDIKPSNLLLDLEGDVWVSDFGLAQIENNTGLTVTGAIVGTLRYMSPEQVVGRRVGVDHRTDIYSLGMTLYELLTLKHAFAGESREMIMRKITFDEPTRPRKIDGRIPVELETIVMKAMSKNPADRYQTASELADDLRRYRDNEPIKGRNPSLARRLVRWSSRNRPLVASLGLLFLTVFFASLVIAGTTWNLYETTAAALATEQEQKAEVERLYQRSEGLRLAANSNLELNRDPTRALLLALEGAERFPGNDTNAAILDALHEKHEFQTLSGHPGPVGHLAFNSSGTRLISSAIKERFDQGPDPAMIWDTQSGALVGKLLDEKTITSAVFSPDNFRILTVSSPQQNTILEDSDDASSALAPSLWDAVTLMKLVTFEDAFAFDADLTTFDPQGRRAVFPSSDRNAAIYDCVAGHQLVELVGHQKRVVYAAFGPQGKRVVTASNDNTVRVWDAATGKSIHEFTLWRQRDPNSVRCLIDCVAFRPDGRHLMTGSSSFGIHLWDLESGERVNSQHLPGNRASYWPAAPQMITHTLDGSLLELRNAATGTGFAQLKPESGLVRQAEISPDGNWIAMRGYSDARLVSIWNVARRKVETLLKGHQFIVNDIAFSPDSQWVATASSDKTVRLWHIAPGIDRMTYPSRTPWNGPQPVPSPDGKQLAIVSADAVTVGRIENFSQPDQAVEIKGRLWMPQYTSTRFIATNGNRLSLHSVDDGQVVGSISNPNGRIQQAAISFDGSRVAAATSKMLLLWRPDENRQLALDETTSRILRLRFAPSGKQLAVATEDGFLRFWETDSGQLQSERQCDGAVLDIVYSPDGTQIAATTDQDRTVVWDAATFRELQTLQSPESQFNRSEFSYDGKFLISYRSSQSKAVYLWDLGTGNLESKLDVSGEVHVAMDPIGNDALVTSSRDGAMIWQYDLNQRTPLSGQPMLCGRYTKDGTELVTSSALSESDQPRQIGERSDDFSRPVLERWRRSDLSKIGTLQPAGMRAIELFYSSDDRIVVNASTSAGLVNYDVATHQPIFRIHRHAAPITAALFTSDARRLVTASLDQTVSIWDAADGRPIKTLAGHAAAVNCLAISADDRLLISGGDDGTLIVWDLQTGQSKTQFRPHPASIRSMELAASGEQVLVINSDNSLHRYDLADGSELESDFGQDRVEWAEYSPDGKSLLVIPSPDLNRGSQLQYPLLIAPLDGGVITSIDCGAPLATAHFLPDGRQVLLATRDGNVTIREIASGTVKKRFPHVGEHAMAATLDPSGRYAAVVTPDRLTIWKVSEESKWLSIPRMNVMPGPMHDYQPFVPQAGLILSQRTDNGQILGWPIEPAELAQSQHLRSLTQREMERFWIK